MKNEFFKDTRILDAIDHIDSDLIAETAQRIRPPASPKREAEQSKKTKFFTAWKQAAALVACAVLMGALIPTVSYISGGVANLLAGSGMAQDETFDIDHDGKPPVETEETAEVLDETESTEAVHDGSEGLLYEMSEDGTRAFFVGFGTCTDEDIVIASTYNGVPVTEMKNKHTYPREKFINEYAKSIRVSDSVEMIHDEVFCYCPNLESIHIGASVWYIVPPRADYYDLKVTDITVSPENKTFTSTTGCLIEKGSKKIIFGCNNCVIPDDGSVVMIDILAFYGNRTLEHLVIPDCIRRIESEAFSNCDNLKSVVLPKNLEFLGEGAFEFSRSLVSVDLNGYTVIPGWAFNMAPKLTEIKGIENVTEIGQAAFVICHSLASINLGVGLKAIGESALWYPVEINYSGTVEQWKAIEKGEEWYEYPVEYTEADLPNLIICSDGALKPCQ